LLRAELPRRALLLPGLPLIGVKGRDDNKVKVPNEVKGQRGKRLENTDQIRYEMMWLAGGSPGQNVDSMWMCLLSVLFDRSDTSSAVSHTWICNGRFGLRRFWFVRRWMTGMWEGSHVGGGGESGGVIRSAQAGGALSDRQCFDRQRSDRR
jgi:hypothetical protein